MKTKLRFGIIIYDCFLIIFSWSHICIIHSQSFAYYDDHYVWINFTYSYCILKRLRPLSHTKTSNKIKDANNNINNNSSVEDDSNEPALPLSSKNCYITPVQHDNEQKECLYNKNSKCHSFTKRLSTNSDSPVRLATNNLLRYDTSSTNILCLSEEQNQILRA